MDFETRIKFRGDLKPFFELVCGDYDIGKYIKHKLVAVGYEDYNLILETEKNKFFVKIFSDFRSNEDCFRYTEIITKVLEAGINHPKLIFSPEGPLYIRQFESYKFRLVIMEYINGASFYDKNLLPNEDEKRYLIQQATKINQIKINPDFIYDSWAITSFSKEFEKAKGCLTKEELETTEPLLQEFLSLDINQLPHCFVHGDIIKTNVLKADDGRLYIIDFSVSNYYPRIQELAVLLCDILFNRDDSDENQKNYQLALNEYQKIIPLTDLEIKTLPLFAKIAHAMHVVRGAYEKRVEKNNSSENEYFVNLGRKGLDI